MNSLVQPLTWIFAIVFLIVGILGFFMNPVLGIFEVDTMHNIVHLGSGLVALLTAGKYSTARLYLIIFGLVYAIVAILGFATGSVLGLIAVNHADHWLHAVIAVVTLLVGLTSSPRKV